MKAATIIAACALIAGLRKKTDSEVLVVGAPDDLIGDFISSWKTAGRVDRSHYGGSSHIGKGQRKANKRNRWK